MDELLLYSELEVIVVVVLDEESSEIDSVVDGAMEDESVEVEVVVEAVEELEDCGNDLRYKLSRSPAPHFCLRSPGHSNEHSAIAVGTLPSFRVLPQKHLKMLN